MTTQYRSHQAGDTIVEVIIAVLIVSMLLTGAFIVTNRSTQAVRDSQEHAEALQALQGQLELVRAAAAAKQLPGALTIPFCLDSSLASFPANSVSCTGAGGPPGYQLSIVCSTAAGTDGCPAPSGKTSTFDLVTTWSSVSGGTDKVYLSYKVATP
jgi:Tfp pilus assembly protein PilV